MKRVLSLLLLGPLVVSLQLAAQQPAIAQGYPVRPVKVIVPYPPGAAADIIGRTWRKSFPTQLERSSS
jgi:tripartite-type tricarboxylate transporter receptor subunit TctC